MDQGTIKEYRKLERELQAKHPDSWKDAERIAKNITDPRTADVGKIWACLWAIPLYAHIKVELAKKSRELLAPYMKDVDEWGEPSGIIRFRRVGKGFSEKSFRADTQRAKEIRKETRVAMHRLFAIQGAAEALHLRAKKSETPFADLVDKTISDRVETIVHEMGFGWGYTTALHFLTDLGLGCKPDIHVFNTVQHLRGVPTSLRTKNPSRKEAIEVNKFVVDLVASPNGSVAPEQLRFADKVLMEISKTHLIKP